MDIGGAGVTVTPSAALALGATPQPTVLVVVPLSASVGLGVTPPAQPGKSVVVGATVALGVTPTAAVRVAVVPLPALALGVTPTPTALTGIVITVRPPYVSIMRGRVRATRFGAVRAYKSGNLYNELGGQLSSSDHGKVSV